MRKLYRISSTLLASLLAVQAAIARDASSPALPAALPREDALPPTQPHDRALRWSLIYTGDANADVSGGARTGAAYLHRIGLIGEWDLARAFGWRGARAHVSVHAIAGTGLSAQRTGNVLTVSGVEAEPALRLFNLWIEQKLGERVTLRAGQFNADQDFVLSPTAAHMVNSTFGWPGSFASDLPSGGPAYPLATPGLSLAVAATPQTSLRMAVFAGDPGGPGSGDPQRRNLNGFNGFHFKGRPFLIGELRHAAKEADPAWSLVLGGWVHFDRFDDLRVDRAGTSLAAPEAFGAPRSHLGNLAIYAIADARLASISGRALHGFLRATASPADRNPIDLYADAGLTLSGPFRHRQDDTLALGLTFARISPRLRALHRDSCARAGARCRTPVGEMVIEASYQIKLRDDLTLQPDVQLIVHPSAALLGDPMALQAGPGNALIIGLRTSFRL